MKLKKGTTIKKEFPGEGAFIGTPISEDTVNSTLYPGEERTAYTFKYPDGFEEDLEEDEVRRLLPTTDIPERAYVIKCLKPGFDYLNKRLTGDCQPHFDCSHMYEVCELAQAFDPEYARAHVDDAFMDRLSTIKPIAGLVPGLRGELSKYVTLAKGSTFDTTDVAAFSDKVLEWWAAHALELPLWSAAARIVFALSPNSASCERVFSLLANFLGDQQMSALADGIAAAMMLAYNGRDVG